MREDSVLVSVDDIVCLRDTAKAIFIQPVGINPDETKIKSIWLPKSQIHPTSQVNIKGDVGKLVISEWIYNQKKNEKEGENGWEGYPPAVVLERKNG